MGDAPCKKRVSRRGLSSLLCTLALSSLACTSAPRVSVQSAVSSLADPPMHLREGGARRGASFGELHETARLLIIAHGLSGDWLARGVISIPVQSCLTAVALTHSEARECTLVALADATTAVLVLSESEQCDRAECLEQSFVFLNDQRAALPLPPRRAADYSSLRADLSREYAEALWLAGYRGRRDARVADANDPYAEPEESLADERPGIAGYASCTRAPRAMELVCRSREGHLIGLDPLSAVERVIARLELDARAGVLSTQGNDAPPFYTSEGKLAVTVRVERHPLCGERACTLLGMVDEHAGVVLLARGPARFERPER
jgi:hypothetical protein